MKKYSCLLSLLLLGCEAQTSGGSKNYLGRNASEGGETNRDDDSDHPSEPEIEADPIDGEDALSRTMKEIDILIKDYSHCRDEEAKCESLNLHSGATVDADLSREAILIIDQGMWFSAMTFHKDRVLAHLSLNLSDPDLVESTEKTISVPLHLQKIVDLYAENLQGSFSPGAYKELWSPFNKAFNAVWKPHIGHGDPIFNTIASLNDDVNFVLVHTEDFIDKDICQLKEDEHIARVRQKGRETSERILDLISRYGIKYINLSLGLSKHDIHDELRKASCEEGDFTAEEIDTYFTARLEFFNFVKAESGAQTFQAAPYPNRPITAHNRPDFAFDCEDISNRFMVGFSTIGDNIKPEGLNEAKFLKGTQYNAIPCTDVFINFDYDLEGEEAGLRPVYYSVNGFSYSKNLSPSTSYATPIALSYSRYLKDTGAIEDKKQAFPWRRDEFRIVDPFRANEFQDKHDFF